MTFANLIQCIQKLNEKCQKEDYNINKIRKLSEKLTEYPIKILAELKRLDGSYNEIINLLDKY